MDYNNLVSKELIKYLEEMFPDKLPPVGCDIGEVAYLQGQRSVVTRLTQLFEDDHGWTIGGQSTSSKT